MAEICQERVWELNESKPFDDVSKITFTKLRTMCRDGHMGKEQRLPIY
jgi:hypothetical protein